MAQKSENIVERSLWGNLSKEELKIYQEDRKLYQEHILEQYKIYVEMADRISARRHLANVFFLTLNTSIFVAIGFILEKLDQPIIPARAYYVIPLMAFMVLTYTWWRLIKSYRQLNTGKYKVVGYLEKRLPSSPYWSAEWKELGEGKDPSKYTPLTQVEEVVPFIFGLLYFSSMLFLLFMK
jgi:hypothetical protein